MVDTSYKYKCVCNATVIGTQNVVAAEPPASPPRPRQGPPLLLLLRLLFLVRHAPHALRVRHKAKLLVQRHDIGLCSQWQMDGWEVLTCGGGDKAGCA